MPMTWKSTKYFDVIESKTCVENSLDKQDAITFWRYKHEIFLMLNDDLKITGNAGNREEANEVENSSEAAQVKSFRKTCQILGIRIFTIFLK